MCFQGAVGRTGAPGPPGLAGEGTQGQKVVTVFSKMRGGNPWLSLYQIQESALPSLRTSWLTSLCFQGEPGFQGISGPRGLPGQGLQGDKVKMQTYTIRMAFYLLQLINWSTRQMCCMAGRSRIQRWKRQEGRKRRVWREGSHWTFGIGFSF